MGSIIRKFQSHGKREVKRDGERGFTLIETSIALVLMMIAGLATASLFVYAINYNSGSYDRSLALAVAQQQMERLRKDSFSEVVSSSAPDVESGGRHFSVVTTVSGSATLKNIMIQVSPQGAGATWVRNPVTIVSQRASTGTGTYFP